MKKSKNLVVINLDRPRFLRYGHKALKKMTALTGKSLTELDNGQFNLENMEIILFCGLLSDAKEHNEILKLEDMEDLLDYADNYKEVMNKLTEALNMSFGEDEEKEKIVTEKN